jgi:hypothetical protein
MTSTKHEGSVSESRHKISSVHIDHCMLYERDISTLKMHLTPLHAHLQAKAIAQQL